MGSFGQFWTSLFTLEDGGYIFELHPEQFPDLPEGVVCHSFAVRLPNKDVLDMWVEWVRRIFDVFRDPEKYLLPHAEASRSAYTSAFVPRNVGFGFDNLVVGKIDNFVPTDSAPYRMLSLYTPILSEFHEKTETGVVLPQDLMHEAREAIWDVCTGGQNV